MPPLLRRAGLERQTEHFSSIFEILCISGDAPGVLGVWDFGMADLAPATRIQPHDSQAEADQLIITYGSHSVEPAGPCGQAIWTTITPSVRITYVHTCSTYIHVVHCTCSTCMDGRLALFPMQPTQQIDSLCATCATRAPFPASCPCNYMYITCNPYVHNPYVRITPHTLCFRKGCAGGCAGCGLVVGSWGAYMIAGVVHVSACNLACNLDTCKQSCGVQAYHDKPMSPMSHMSRPTPCQTTPNETSHITGTEIIIAMFRLFTANKTPTKHFPSGNRPDCAKKGSSIPSCCFVVCTSRYAFVYMWSVDFPSTGSAILSGPSRKSIPPMSHSVVLVQLLEPPSCTLQDAIVRDLLPR